MPGTTRETKYREFFNGKELEDGGEKGRKWWRISDFLAMFASVFLPQGYPDSVSRDYIEYQKWDTLQALASSLTGALATEAVLTGAGVGRETSTALAAALTWLVKDGLGMIGRIVFSYFKGSELDADCKKWRLVADVLNDVAFCVDLANSLFPGFFTILACTSSLFRCIVGVAGGATRATIVQHQARRNNLADVSAKDGSQETLVNAVAIVLSLVLLPAVSGKSTVIWSLFGILTCCHIYANYRAVKSLHIATLNKKRATLAMRHWIKTGTVPSIDECNRQEPLFFDVCGRRDMGVSIGRLPRGAHVVSEHVKVGVVAVDRRSNSAWTAVCRPNSTWPIKLGTRTMQQIYLYFVCEMMLREDQIYKYDEKTTMREFQKFTEELEKKGYDLSASSLGFDEYEYEYDQNEGSKKKN